MTITISLNIAIDGADLATAIDKLAAIGRGVVLLAESSNGMNGIDNAHPAYPSYPSHDQNEPKPPNAPRRRQTTTRPPKLPARPVAHETAPIRAATINGAPLAPVANPAPNGDTSPRFGKFTARPESGDRRSAFAPVQSPFFCRVRPALSRRNEAAQYGWPATRSQLVEQRAQPGATHDGRRVAALWDNDPDRPGAQVRFAAALIGGKGKQTMRLRVTVSLINVRQVEIEIDSPNTHPGDVKQLVFVAAHRQFGEHDEVRIVSVEEVVGEEAPNATLP